MSAWAILIVPTVLRSPEHAGAVAQAVAVAKELSSLSPISVVTTVALLEGVNIMVFITREYLREKFLKPLHERQRAEAVAEGRAKGREEGREEGRVKGREEGREEGQQQGQADMYRAWMNWNHRRVEAERRGRQFDEPPPSDPRAG